MVNEGAQQVLLALQGASMVTGDVSECEEIETRVVGQWIGFQIIPGVFDRVQFRCIGRQKLATDGGVIGQELVDGFGPVGIEPIPDEDHGIAVQLAVQLAQESDNQRRSDVGVRMQAEIQMHPVAGWRDTQGGDHRYLAMRSRALGQDRGLAARAPAAAHQRGRQNPAFVEKNQPGFPARGVFFTRGQSCLTHRWMASSSRSIARRVGFCGLKPRPCNSRPT